MSVIEEIKQRLDIVEFIGEYVKLQKSGRNFRALCPFHSEKTPSFFVFPEQQSWHCFGACSTGGDIYSFVMKREGVDFGQALRLLAERAGVTLISPDVQNKDEDERKERIIRINEAAAAYYHHLLLSTTAGGKAKKYLTQRSISLQTIENFQLGFSRDSFEDLQRHLLGEGYEKTELLTAGLVVEREGGGFYDRFRNRLMFPIRDIKGHVIGFGARVLDESLPKYLNSPQTPIFDKSSTLYAFDRAKESIRKKDEAIIMEGYMDVLTAHQHGWDNVVASMGTALTEKQLASLKKITKNIILALDADTAGEMAELRTVETLELPDIVTILRTVDVNGIFDINVKVVVPSQGKDPDEEIRKDPALWSQSLERAKPIMNFIFDIAKDKFDSGDIKDKTLVTERLLQLICVIENSIIRGHYVQEVARIARVNPKDLEDRINKIRLDKRKQKTKTIISPTPTKSVSLSPNPIEKHCLWLLLQYPVLRADGMKLSEVFFESSESREIFLNWKQSTDINSLRNNLDSTLHPYLDDLMSKPYSRTIIASEDKQRRDLSACVVRLREKLYKGIESKKEELLAMEAKRGSEEELAEQGIEESKQLKSIFIEQSHRRHSTS